MMVGRDEDEQVALLAVILALGEEIANARNISKDRNFLAGLGHFILEQAADRQRIAAPDHYIRFERPGCR